MKTSDIKPGQQWQAKADQKIAVIVSVTRHDVTYSREGSERQFTLTKYSFIKLYAPC